MHSSVTSAEISFISFSLILMFIITFIQFYEENEKQKLEAASNRLRAILLPAGIKRSANDSDSDAPKTKVIFLICVL